MENTTINVLIAGVGGQGTILASRVLGKYALLCGKDCKISEIHGMSQRGGSVSTHLRMGDKVHSPVVWEGGADVVIAFETLEAYRVSHYLKADGVLLVNEEKILPMPCQNDATNPPRNSFMISYAVYSVCLSINFIRTLPCVRVMRLIMGVYSSRISL